MIESLQQYQDTTTATLNNWRNLPFRKSLTRKTRMTRMGGMVTLLVLEFPKGLEPTANGWYFRLIVLPKEST